MAAYNGLHQVVSGEVESVDRLLERCESAGVRAERLRVSHGFHSGLMEPVLDELEGLLAGVEARGAAEAALVSNVTGGVLGTGERMDGVYWRRHAREAVAFGAGVAELAELGVEVLVELGPGPVLGRMASLAWPEAAGEEAGAASGSAARRSLEPVVVSSLRGRGRKAEEIGTVSSGSGFEEAVAAAYVVGLEVGFAGMFAGEDRRRVSLPGYPFQRQRYWVEGGRRGRVGGAEHPLLGGRHESARGETVFETELYATEPEWLWDHRVFGRVVAPGAMYGAMALMAASLCAGPEDASAGVTLTDMRFHVPLVLPEGSGEGGEPGRRVQVVLGAADGSKQRPVEVYSRDEEPGGWTLHAEARVGLDAAAPEAGTDLGALVEGLSEHDVASAYRWFAAAGGELGPSFRVVQSLWSGAGEVVGEVSLSAESSEPGVNVHPVVLDGCFQVMMPVMKEWTEDSGVGEGEAAPLYLPFGWERLWVRGALPERVTCRARLRRGGGESGEVVSADLWLYGEDGAEVGGVAGLVFKRATRAALLAAGRGEELLHEVAWRPVSAGAEAGAVESPVLLVNVGGGESATAEALSAALAGRGVEVVRGWDSDPGRLAASAAGVSGLVAVAPGWSGEEELSLGSLGWLLGLVQALVESETSLGLGMVVVTESGVPAETGERVDPWAASVWGFGRSVQTEQPGLGLRLVDVGPGVSGDEDGWMVGAMELAAGAVLGVGEETQTAVRGAGLLAPRLERVGRSEEGRGVGAAGARGGELPGDGGGWDTWGWRWRSGWRGGERDTWSWWGRRGPDERVRERLAGLESETGCRVVTVQADVGEGEEVSGLLGRFARTDAEEREWPRLGGDIPCRGGVGRRDRDGTDSGAIRGGDAGEGVGCVASASRDGGSGVGSVRAVFVGVGGAGVRGAEQLRGGERVFGRVGGVAGERGAGRDERGVGGVGRRWDGDGGEGVGDGGADGAVADDSGTSARGTGAVAGERASERGGGGCGLAADGGVSGSSADPWPGCCRARRRGKGGCWSGWARRRYRSVRGCCWGSCSGSCRWCWGRRLCRNPVWGFSIWGWTR